MSLITALRFNMTNTADAAARHGDRYRAALEMAGYADEHGFTAVSCEEHHLAETGWLPAPLVMSAALAGRTSRIRISVNALLITLCDPVRLAEDIAVLDNLSQGRFSFVAGMGYRPENGSTVTLLSTDPDQAWRWYGDCIMNEAAEYAGWRRTGVPRPHETPAGSVAELRALNMVEILTPEQLLFQINAGRKEVVMNPLIGGLPLEAGWTSLRLLGKLLDPGGL